MNNTLQVEPISKNLPSFLAPNVMEGTIYKSRRSLASRIPPLECLWQARNMSPTTPLTALCARVWKSFVELDGLNKIGLWYLFVFTGKCNLVGYAVLGLGLVSSILELRLEFI